MLSLISFLLYPKNLKMDKKILSISDAASILGVSDETLRNWEREGLRELLKSKDSKVLNATDLYDFLVNIKLTTKVHNYPKHYVWEEDGVKYSCWELAPGLSTGDKGFELYQKVLKEYAESLST